MNNPFVLHHFYSDGSAKPTIIYAGGDKAAAFEALWKFLMEDVSQDGCGLYRHSTPTPFMDTTGIEGGE